MSWLMTQMWVELLIAAVFGGIAGWAAHILYGRQMAKAHADTSASGGADGDNHSRIAQLEKQLREEQAESDVIRRKAGIQRAGEEGAPAEGSLMWRNRHLESRVRFLEGKLADLESDAQPTRPAEDQNDEATRLRWRNRYLEGRVKYLEEELVRTGGLVPATVMPAAASQETTSISKVKAPEGDQPELFEVPRDGVADDLKLISGIGPKLEQKLNSIGIWHYTQIASWTQSEIDWVNAAISFRGRIERERWVMQAKALLEGAAPAEAESNPG
jgi:predicted flap endonuclease-1-like 5' DNA nuclease